MFDSDRYKKAQDAEKAGDMDLYNHHMKIHHQKTSWNPKEDKVRRKESQRSADWHHSLIKDKTRQFKEDISMSSEAAKVLVIHATDQHPVEFRQVFNQAMNDRILAHIDAEKQALSDTRFDFDPEGDDPINKVETPEPKEPDADGEDS